ncbi:MAG TPA: hypothetical protein VFX23_11295 [Limnobacter sp.]|uniref:hypothetical protein n=1 Tax=Limnobacter sp. TaxID=2003368 RepID=UPI002E35BC66|nr:hypothetical protein [Limnobacter sp.]HEX5486569.1 hypothetical protein [Limnobacter sp.]
MSEFVEPSLGVFALEPVSGDNNALRLVLKLDYYQSNCLRMWLDLRWQAACLCGSTIHAVRPNQVVISKAIPDSEAHSPIEALKHWKTQVLRQFNLYLSSRR